MRRTRSGSTCLMYILAHKQLLSTRGWVDEPELNSTVVMIVLALVFFFCLAACCHTAVICHFTITAYSGLRRPQAIKTSSARLPKM